jgi:multidrug resistance efflux pump
MINETRRMLNEAAANLANNTNIHILSAEASLTAAALSLETAERNHSDALRDYNLRLNPHVVTAESLLRSAQVELDRLEASHANLNVLYAAGIATSEEMRLSENALTHARNQHNDAVVNRDNALELERRSINQLEMALRASETAYANATELLAASRIAATQDIERLRSNVISAETAGNLEPMELALEQLERHLADSYITSPISGTVTALIAREGAAGIGLMFTVEDTDNLRIIASFREYDIGDLAVGMEVSITSDATGDSVYSGVISRINPAANAFSPVVEFETEITVTSPNTGLRLGMNTRVEVETE